MKVVLACGSNAIEDFQDADFVQQRNTSSVDVICDTLAQLDVAAYLRAGGLSEVELDAVRVRLLG